MHPYTSLSLGIFRLVDHGQDLAEDDIRVFAPSCRSPCCRSSLCRTSTVAATSRLHESGDALDVRQVTVRAKLDVLEADTLEQRLQEHSLDDGNVSVRPSVDEEEVGGKERGVNDLRGKSRRPSKKKGSGHARTSEENQGDQLLLLLPRLTT